MDTDKLLFELAVTVEGLMDAIEEAAYLRSQGKDSTLVESKIMAEAKVSILTERKFFIGRVLDARKQ